MAYFRTRDGCSLYYETVGFDRARPVVVFLNGTLQTTMYWKVIAASLKPEFRSLLYDARGQGESDLGALPLSLDLHLEDLLALLDHLSTGPVSLVGLSHGALLAYALGCRQPDRVKRLVLCSIGMRPSIRSRLIVRSWLPIAETGGLEPMVKAVLPHVFGKAYLAHNRNHLDRVVKTIVRRNRRDSLVAHLSAMTTYPRLGAFLQKMNFPLLVLCGSDDPLVSVDGATEVAEKSGGRCITVEDAGHSVPVEAPKLFLKTLQQFLANRWTGMPEAI